MPKNAKFNLKKDVSPSPTIASENIDTFSYDKLLKNNPPHIIAIDIAEKNADEIALPLAQHQERRITINAERYSTAEIVRQNYYADILSSFSHKNQRAELSTRLHRQPRQTAKKWLAATLIPLVAIVLSVLIVLMNLYWLGDILPNFVALLPICLAGLFLGCLCAIKKQPVSIQDKLLRLLYKTKRLHKTVVVVGVERLNYETRQELFRQAYVGLKFSPLNTIFLTYGNGISDFNDYFNMQNMYFHIDRFENSKDNTEPLVNIDFSSESGELKNVESPLLMQSPIVKKPDVIIVQPQEDTHNPQQNSVSQKIDFNFEQSTAREILGALASGTISQLPPHDLFSGCMLKVSKMQEKTLNEYLTALSYIIDKTDFERVETKLLEQKAVDRLAGWYEREQRTEKLSPLFRACLKQKSYAAAAGFAPYLDAEQSELLEKFVSTALDEMFVDNVSPLVLSPLLTCGYADLSKFIGCAIAYVKRFSKADLLAEKPNFAAGFCDLLATISSLLLESDIESVYNFLASLLKNSTESTVVTAAMSTISAFKERFRFGGYAISNLNDIIFDKEFATIDEKFKYIDDLLTGSNLEVSEKNRYIFYLLNSQDKVLPRHRAMILSSMLKGGAEIHRENILDAVAEYEHTNDEEYLAQLSDLLKNYYKTLKKDNNFILDICCQNIDTTLRGEVVAKFLSDNPLISNKIIKHLLTSAPNLNRADVDSTVLYALSSKCISQKFPRDEFIEFVDYLFAKQESATALKLLIRSLVTLYSDITLSGDQKHDFKSSMFKAAAAFDDEDFSVETQAALIIFKIDYISFTEQKIAHQGNEQIKKQAQQLIIELIGGNKE